MVPPELSGSGLPWEVDLNFSEMKTAIQDYVQSDEETFVSHLDQFVRNAEDRVYRSVQLPAFFKSTAAGDIGAVTTITLPAGSIEVYSIRVSKTAGDDDGEWTYLLKKDWDFLLEAYPGTASAVSTGVPRYYALSSDIDNDVDPQVKIEIAPKPSAADFRYVVDYYGKAAADSLTVSDTTVTWLSVTFPDVLLYGAIADAYYFLKSEASLLQYAEGRFMEGLESMISVISNKGSKNRSSAIPTPSIQAGAR